MREQDLDQPATRRDVQALETATRRDLLALEARVDTRFDELRRHFDVVAESFKTEFRNLFDWTQTTTSTLGGRLDRLEVDHQARVGSVELHVAQLERLRKPR